MIRTVCLNFRRRGGGLLALALLLCPGCEEDFQAVYRSRWLVPPEWPEWSGTPPTVSAKVVAAHRVPTPHGDGSLLVCLSPYIPDTEVEQLLAERRSLLMSLPSVDLKDAREVQVDGTPAARIEATARGTGSNVFPSGPGVPARENEKLTRRVWVIIPRGPEEGTLELYFHCPEAAYSTLAPSWEAVLDSLKVRER